MEMKASRIFYLLSSPSALVALVSVHKYIFTGHHLIPGERMVAASLIGGVLLLSGLMANAIEENLQP